MQDTDSDIKKRYEQLEAEVLWLKQEGRTPANITLEEHLRALDLRIEALKRDWLEVLSRKTCGTLTDTTNTDQVKKVIETWAEMSQIPIRVVLTEGERNEHNISRTWIVEAIYAGENEDYSEGRWLNTLQKIQGELVALPFVNTERSPMVRETVEGSEITRVKCKWMVDTIVWNWPAFPNRGGITEEASSRTHA